VNAEWQDDLERAQADGKITVEDADVVREFGEFLDEAGPPPGQPGTDPERRKAAIRNHHELVMGPLPHPPYCFVCNEEKS
jgi:hypothetical protein